MILYIIVHNQFVYMKSVAMSLYDIILIVLAARDLGRMDSKEIVVIVLS